MARRRPKAVPDPTSAPDLMPVSARVAWAYLAVVVALVATVLVLSAANETLARVFCPADPADLTGDAQLSCEVGFVIWTTIAGFLLCLLPALRLVKLDLWLWLAAFAGAGFLVAADAATEWWWWLAAALLPALAALASADWGRGRTFRRWQLAGLAVLAAAAIGALAFWYVAG